MFELHAAAPLQLLRASAGTGKTYQLVAAYTQLIVQAGLRPSALVVLTFTRKAALELRLRIQASLRAAAVSASVLAELDAAPPTNFHGLCLRLLREFAPHQAVQEAVDAPAAGLPKTLLGEPQADALRFQTACEAAWLQPRCSAAVQQLAPYFDLRQQLPQALWAACSRVREEGQGAGLDKLATPAASPLLQPYDVAAALQQAQAGCASLQQSFAAALQTLRGVRQAAAQRTAAKLQACLQAIPAAPPKTAELTNWLAAWHQALQQLDRRGALGKLYTAEMQQQVTQGLDNLAAEILCARLQPAWTQLSAAAWQRYQADKQHDNVVDFADVVSDTVALLRQQTALRQAVQQRTAAVLLDEAQDTNVLQRELIYLLSGLPGAGVQRARSPAQVWAVGDWKQAIYTFRGADADSFAQLRRDLLQQGGREAILSQSWRARPVLLEAINSLGVSLFGAPYEALTAPQAETPTAIAAAPMLWLQATAAPAAKSTERPAEQRDAAEAQCVAQWLAQQLQAGAQPRQFAVLMATMSAAPLFASALQAQGIAVQVSGGGNFFTQREIVDVLALLRWLVDPTEHLAAAIALRAPLFGLTDAALLALLQPQLLTLEATSKAATPPLQQLYAGDVPAACEPGFATAYLSATEQNLLQRLPPLVQQLRQTAQDAGPQAVLRWLEHSLQLQQVYCAGDAASGQVEANLAYLQQLAAASEARHGAVLAPFVRHLQQLAAQSSPTPLPPLPPVAACVTLSSVHQSKGLQYPVVILPTLSKTGRQDSPVVHYARQHGLSFKPRQYGVAYKSARYQQAQQTQAVAAEQELRRLLYVAVSRAQHQVVWVAPPALPARHSNQSTFASLLQPWHAGARAAGLLQDVTLDLTPPQPRQAPPPVPHADVACLDSQVALKQAPPHSRFSWTVSAAAPPLDAPQKTPASQVPQFARLPSSHDRTGSSQRHLGDFAHAVLAQLEGLQHVEPAAFLRQAMAQVHATCSVALPSAAQWRALQQHLLAFLRAPLGQQICQLPPAQRGHELPFCCEVANLPYPTYLRGQWDLLYWDDAGPVIVDYKYAPFDASVLARYHWQLSAYAYALAQLCGIDAPIRTYLVFLQASQPPMPYVVGATARQQIGKQLQQRSAAHALWSPPIHCLDV